MCIVCVPNVWHCSLNERITEEHFHIVFEATGVSHLNWSFVVSSGTVEVVAVLSDKHGQHVSTENRCVMEEWHNFEISIKSISRILERTRSA
jgi:hypothetical protein